MKNPHHFIRILQSLTGLTIVGFALFIGTNLSQKNDDKKPAPPTQAAAKVPRPKAVAIANYAQSLNNGDIALANGDVDEALELYQKAAEVAPKEYLPYEKIGDLQLFQKKYVEASQSFGIARELKPLNPSLTVKHVRSLLGERKISEAHTELKTITPSTQASLYYQGLIAAFFGDSKGAKVLLAESLKSGNDEHIKMSAQKILTVYRDFDLAREGPVEYFQALLAAAFDEVGENGLAIEIGFAAVKTKPDYRDAWIAIGHAFLNEHRWLDAEDGFTKALELDAGHPTSLFFRGIARSFLAKYPEAVSDFTGALSFGFKPHILVKQYLADAYFGMHENAKAYPLYKEVALGDPSDINRFVRPMALVINELKLPFEAAELAQKAYATHPETGMAYNLLGWAALANHQNAKAREYLNAAVAKDPELSAAYLNLGELAEAEGQTAQALQYYTTAKRLAEKNHTTSIGEAASIRYNELKNTPSVESTRPIPSLNLY